MCKLFRFIALVLSVSLALTAFSGCGRKKIQLQNFPIENYTPPEQGDEIIVMDIEDYGEVRIRLFPELLPEACENFITLAEQGYYDELIFHRVIENFMIQGGDPKGDGTGGESCWGGFFDGGVSRNLIHVPGALAYANGGSTSTDGSQFYIVTGEPVTQAMLDGFTENEQMYFPPDAEELYLQYGGAPFLDGKYTVFGQVIDGLDIIFEISKTETDENDKPKNAVHIKSVRTEAYNNSEIRWYLSDYDSVS